MANTISHLLNPNELLDIYGIPSLSPQEQTEVFSFNAEEINLLTSFRDIQDSLYFALCLVFFKMKKTFVDFKYHQVTIYKNHLMVRYFPKKSSPKKLPNIRQITRIKAMVLDLCEYQRCSKTLQNKLIQDLVERAPHYPRQRQLCKEILNLLVKERIAIPGYTALQEALFARGGGVLKIG